MAWLYLRLPGGTLKVKPRSHLRNMELDGRVPMLDLGVIVFAWWSHKRQRQEARERMGLPRIDD